MKILALILARGGSKRLKKKNIINLKDKPLITWTIKFAQKLPNITDILVSTDDIKIATIAKKNNAFVPWLRPKHLSLDRTSSASSALHAIEWYENKVTKVDGILLLQPTSPFRNLKTFQKVIKLFKKDFNKSYVSVSKLNSDIPKPNGSLYLISPKKLKKNKNFVTKDSVGILLKTKKENIDIDKISDLELARRAIQ
jgi:CMP-N,N'-diacetyllegionaminic acid synthase